MAQAVRDALPAATGVVAAAVAAKVTRDAAAAWVRSNVTVDPARLEAVVRDVYGAAGNAGANLAVEGIPGGTLPDGAVRVTWADWEPGNRGAADLADLLPVRLDTLDTTIRGITDTQLDLLAGRLADGLEVGADMATIGASIDDVLGTEDRGVMIARTETCRAVEEASQTTYAANGVEEWEWLVSDPCPECEEFDGQRFPVGNDEPTIPLHPGCRCASAGILPSGDLGDEEGDG